MGETRAAHVLVVHCGVGMPTSCSDSQHEDEDSVWGMGNNSDQAAARLWTALCPLSGNPTSPWRNPGVPGKDRNGCTKVQLCIDCCLEWTLFVDLSVCATLTNMGMDPDVTPIEQRRFKGFLTGLLTERKAMNISAASSQELKYSCHEDHHSQPQQQCQQGVFLQDLQTLSPRIGQPRPFWKNSPSDWSGEPGHMSHFVYMHSPHSQHDTHSLF